MNITVSLSSCSFTLLAESCTRASLDPEKKVRDIKASEQIHKEKEHLRSDAS